jgi:hypothetical protein
MNLFLIKALAYIKLLVATNDFSSALFYLPGLQYTYTTAQKPVRGKAFQPESVAQLYFSSPLTSLQISQTGF